MKRVLGSFVVSTQNNKIVSHTALNTQEVLKAILKEASFKRSRISKRHSENQREIRKLYRIMKSNVCFSYFQVT